MRSSFLKNNFRNQNEKLREDIAASTEPDFLLTTLMQSIQPFQLKQVIERVYNKLIMIRTSFLANF